MPVVIVIREAFRAPTRTFASNVSAGSVRLFLRTGGGGCFERTGNGQLIGRGLAGLDDGILTRRRGLDLEDDQFLDFVFGTFLRRFGAPDTKDRGLRLAVLDQPFHVVAEYFSAATQAQGFS